MSIWTLPFDLFTGQPGDIATRLREYDLKARTYQAMGRYWTHIFRLLKGNDRAAELQEEAASVTDRFHQDLLKVFQKFKQGEDYNRLNTIEAMGDRFSKQAHKLVLGSDRVGNTALRDIQELLEGLWDDLWELAAEDRAGFDAVMTKFAFDTWTAMGLPGRDAPTYGRD